MLVDDSLSLAAATAHGQPGYGSLHSGGGYRRWRRPELGVLHLGHAAEHAQRRHVADHRHLLRREIDVERRHACAGKGLISRGPLVV
jgi:hypothetical protein